MTVETLEERGECRIGHSGSVLVLVWFREPTVAALAAFVALPRLSPANDAPSAPPPPRA